MRNLLVGLTVIIIVISTLPLTQGQTGEAQRQRDLALSQTSSERRIALVIGNGAYDSGVLRNAVNDARDLTVALRGLGFEVIEGINLTKRPMEESIRTFGQKIRSGGIGLFYFAGHGVQIKDRNFLIPIHAFIEKEQDIEYESVDVGRVMAEMEAAENRLNIVILDACRNNPFNRSFRTKSSGLAQMNAPSGTLIAYATAPGSVASDNPEGRNGLYTQELLRYVKQPGLEIGKVFRLVRAAVEAKSNKQQIPWESSSLKGEFYFAGTDADVDTEAVSTNPFSSAATEITFWGSIKNSTSPNDFKAYLEKYPGGEFALLAKNRLIALEAAYVWEVIKDSANPNDFKAYLEKYPNAEFVLLARRRLSALEAANAESAKIRNTQQASNPPQEYTFNINHAHQSFTKFRYATGQLVISPAGVRYQEIREDVKMEHNFACSCGQLRKVELKPLNRNELKTIKDLNYYYPIKISFKEANNHDQFFTERSEADRIVQTIRDICGLSN